MDYKKLVQAQYDRLANDGSMELTRDQLIGIGDDLNIMVWVFAGDLALSAHDGASGAAERALGHVLRGLFGDNAQRVHEVLLSNGETIKGACAILRSKDEEVAHALNGSRSQV